MSIRAFRASDTHPTITLRPFALTPPRFLLIGASTGGPQALTALVAQLAPVIERAPVLITQHMPPTFTTILAEHLSRAANCPAREAEDGEADRARPIYLAPGGRHMTVGKKDRRAAIALDDGPLVNFCRPAVDPMFSSAAQTWGMRHPGCSFSPAWAPMGRMARRISSRPAAP